MTRENSIVCIYNHHSGAEAAVKTLQRAGFDMKKLSIVGKDYHTEEHPIGFYNTGDRMKYWGKQGAFWGGVWRFLFGSAFFLIPGIGPIVVAGPLVSWIVGALEGATLVGGLSALGAGLYSIGIPKDSIIKYETAINSGSFLLVAHGTGADVSRAKDIVSSTQPAKSAVLAHRTFRFGVPSCGDAKAPPRAARWIHPKRSVLPTAVHIASVNGARISLVHVVQEPLVTALLDVAKNMELAQELATRHNRHKRHLDRAG